MNAERVRLFVALELPAAVRSSLAEWASRAVRDSSALRALAPDALHVTLCFLGWRWESEVEAVAGACRVAAAGEPPMPLALSEPVWLPPRRPRVLAVDVSDPSGGLGRVQAALSGALAAGGWYTPEARPFLAHVTVARARRDARVRSVALSPPHPVSFEGSLVTLFRSRLGAGGARYEALSRAELGSSPRVKLGSSPLPVDPVAVVERFHSLQREAYAGGPLEPLHELLADDVVWHVPGRSAIAGEHRGVEAVLAYFEKRRSMSRASFRVTVHGATTIGERVVQLAGGSAVLGGREVTWETVGVFRVLDGRIAECWLLPFDQQAFDEIWG